MKTLRSFASVLLLVTSACGHEPPPETELAPGLKIVTVPEIAWLTTDAGTTASFRGLSALSEHVAWVSGTGGTWARTDDGGATWRVKTLPGAEDLDFRDVDAFDSTTAYLMSAGPGELSRIYKTIDGGDSWELQFTNPWPAGFFDGMAFWDAERGLVYGDPVDGRFTVLATTDGGATWTRIPAAGMPKALEGEAGFAASGSGLVVHGEGLAWFGTGGLVARVFRSTDYGQTWTVSATPIAHGAASTGIFSLAFSGALHGVAVGGDYTQPENATGNSARTIDGGITWTLIETAPPAGYRSAVSYIPDSSILTLVAAGTSGSDISIDGGETWKVLSDDNFNCVRFGASTGSGWAAGPDGRIARLGAAATP